ncbi:MAG: DUF3352 domain-containing protein [Candidatus Sumerlaea chitinivorans]|uniref:DUF3352 domain-containing protein n=1 Tax=Sumerlaea chitinivorans TaxID=2250252 RepID=A0A2Z4Y1Z2_SUMC1|nr:hypothetical protein BRCON_0159 [Candidatus Sumerlaea chitinivorans]MCX7964142.1 DUF3352 domain-containing protein [Candidatus Sumerlaea chitinivorans]
MRFISKLARTRLLALVGGLALLVATSFAKVANPKLVPQNAVYVMSVPSTADFWSAWKGNTLYGWGQKVLEASPIGSDLDTLRKLIKNIEGELKFGLDGDTLSKVIAGVDVFILGNPSEGTMSGGLIAKVSDKEKFTRLMTFWEMAAEKAAMEESGGGEDKGTTQSENTSVQQNKDTKGGQEGSKDTPEETSSASPITTETYKSVLIKHFETAKGAKLNYALLEDRFLLASDGQVLKGMIDRAKGEAQEGGFDQAEDFEKVEKALAAKPGQLYLYTNQKALVESHKAEVGPQAALGAVMAELQPVAMGGASVRILSDRIATYTYSPFAAGSENSALRKLAERYPGDVPLEIIKFAPASALVTVATSSFDIYLAYDVVKQIMKALPAEGPSFDLDKQLSEADAMLGFSIRNDLFPAVGNEIGLIVGQVKMEMGIPSVEGAIVVKVRDKAKMEKVLTAVSKLIEEKLKVMTPPPSSGQSAPPAPTFKTETSKGISMRYVEIPNISAWSPGYAMLGDYLVVATTKQTIETMASVRAGEKPSLTENEVFKQMQLSTKGNAFAFVNLSNIWNTAEDIAGATAGTQNAKQILDQLRILRAVGGVGYTKDGAGVSESVILLGASE